MVAASVDAAELPTEKSQTAKDNTEHLRPSRHQSHPTAIRSAGRPQQTDSWLHRRNTAGLAPPPLLTDRKPQLRKPPAATAASKNPPHTPIPAAAWHEIRQKRPGFDLPVTRGPDSADSPKHLVTYQSTSAKTLPPPSHVPANGEPGVEFDATRSLHPCHKIQFTTRSDPDAHSRVSPHVHPRPPRAPHRAREKAAKPWPNRMLALPARPPPRPIPCPH